MDEVDEDIDFAQRVIEGRCLTCESLYLYDGHQHCLECILEGEYALWKDISRPTVDTIVRWGELGILTHMIQYEKRVNKDTQLHE